MQIKNEDNPGIELPILENSDSKLVTEFYAAPANKTVELSIYSEPIGDKLNLNLSFDSSQDFISLYARVRPLSDVEEKEKPLLDIPVTYGSR